MPYDDSSFEQLEPWEQDVATLAFGVDALLGEDPLHESGTRHFVVDSWTSGLDAPKLYNSNFADHMRKTGGIHGKQDPVAIASFIRLHELESLAERAVDGLPTSMDEDRRTFVRNISGALGAMLKTTMAMGKIPGAEMPSYEERYLAATPTETSVRLVDAAPYRERLQEALAVVGFNVTASRDLRKTYLAWEASQGEIPSEQVAEQVAETNAMLLGMTRAKFFDKWGVQLTAHAPNLSDVAFDGSEFRTLASARFTGSSIYRGGQLEDGRPAFRQLYEYNLSHPLNPLSLLLLCAHEMVPGHYIHQAVTDLQWRDNKLGQFPKNKAWKNSRT